MEKERGREREREGGRVFSPDLQVPDVYDVLSGERITKPSRSRKQGR